MERKGREGKGHGVACEMWYNGKREASMDRNDLVQVLRDLDSHLVTDCEMVVIGGAAMILHFGAPRTTRDVDVLVIKGEPATFRESVLAVARERGLPDGWMSDAAKGFADILPPDFQQRLVPLEFNLRHLRLYALGLPEQAAMKIVALREQDLEDLELLMPHMTEEERQVLVRIAHHVARFRSDWAQKLQYFLEEQGWWTD